MNVDGPAMVTRQLDWISDWSAWAADDLGVEVFGRQEHDGVGHRDGRVDVLVADAFASVRMARSKARPAAAISSAMPCS